MTLRVLHTADWHIGQTLNGWSRTFEHQAFFKQLTELVKAHDVDALVMAGDVFDNQNPSADATRLFYEALAELREVNPQFISVITAGNHDPAGRIEAPGVLFERIGVHALGMVHRHDEALDVDRHLVPLTGKDGRVEAYVLAIPFPRASDLPRVSEEGETEGSVVVRAVRALYEDAVARARERIADAPLIVTGHLHVWGAEESEGAERRILVGGEHAIPHSVFDESLAYVALGHLHKPQKVGRETIRYSGSPFPMSVTEQAYQHGVVLLEVDGDKVTWERLPLERPVPFYRLGKGECLQLDEVPGALDALGLDEDLPIDQRPFVHVDLKPQVSGAGLRAELDRLLKGYPVRAAGLSVVRKDRSAPEITEAEALVRLHELEPVDLFKTAFEAAHGVAPEASHLELFHRAAAEIE
ncbi:exonuclease SbcCD subunit D [Pseudovibrio exalbescens]|uniref:exonuclease SbcCD subunit D n=1 Tax=Pseudovibrio exalbescens TaxID=197461 RepID=UPI002366354D|nr:exonuclease SbcCD subunit D [Pseudovibrio exalbescens]MDD7910272.1 exonuclease SbcCD subunit D [Pseudovibrio exalbescens]